MKNNYVKKYAKRFHLINWKKVYGGIELELLWLLIGTETATKQWIKKYIIPTGCKKWKDSGLFSKFAFKYFRRLLPNAIIVDYVTLGLDSFETNN
jgi:hypothetical protein